jgi:tartrate-resistant acid phosphatase type 5
MKNLHRWLVKTALGVCGWAVLLAACSPAFVADVTTLPAAPISTETPVSTGTNTPVPTSPVTPTSSQTPIPQTVRFAVIGDYGLDGPAEADVAALVKSWQPDFIITVGDNNYPDGAVDTMDANVGKYYASYIFPYAGDYGPGADRNRFFPALGDHDWISNDAQAHFDYFSLPGNERYYDFTWGPVQLFALDSIEHEPDGINLGSQQAAWLQQALTASTAQWQVVYMHSPPYSSGAHGSIDWMRWHFADWGADAVLAGDEHLYERLQVDGIPYFTVGTGGGGLYDFGDPLPESMFRYNANYGAMLVTASQGELRFEFFSRTGILVDQYSVNR